MQVLCRECGFSGMFDPARAPEHPFTIKCPKCGAAIMMNGRVPVPVDAAKGAAFQRSTIYNPNIPSGAQQEQAAPPPPPPTAIPPMPPGAKRIDTLLHTMVDLKASDLHMSSDCPPMIRRDGEMTPIPGWPALSAGDLKNILWEITPDRIKAQFEERHDTDYAYEIEGLARFRVNVFMDRKGPGAVFRVIPSKIITAEDLSLSKEILNLCRLPKGLVLVTGPTGSGKSTTLCAMIDYINRTRKDHMITIEDPIEFVHNNKGCLINQREIHEHTDSFKAALRAALREDPDIVYIGEMRDLETISIAIETAETGHLVFGTLHTSTAPSTIDRIIDQFPGDKQEQIRTMLSESLRGVICQMLCKKVGGGRIAAMEVLIVTPSVSNLIRERKTFQIQSVLQTGKSLGMCTMNDSFLDLVRQKKVTPEEAYDKAIDKPSLISMYEKNGVDLSWYK